jgi:hypothetical protein
MTSDQLIGKVAACYLRDRLTEDDSTGVARYLLDCLTAEQTAAIAKAILEDSSLAQLVEIKLPVHFVGNHGLPPTVPIKLSWNCWMGNIQQTHGGDIVATQERSPNQGNQIMVIGSVSGKAEGSDDADEDEIIAVGHHVDTHPHREVLIKCNAQLRWINIGVLGYLHPKLLCDLSQPFQECSSQTIHNSSIRGQSVQGPQWFSRCLRQKMSCQAKTEWTAARPLNPASWL